MENDRTTTAPSRLRAGFVGAGFMAEVHSRAARAAGADIAGIASSSRTSADRAKDRLGVQQAYDSVQDLVEDDAIDVIHICTPNGTHYGLAEAALKAGKHVVCEKPLATNVQDATELVELAAKAGTVATVPFVYRFHPMIREARERIASGQTGRISAIQGSYLQDWLLSREDDNWRVDATLGGPSRAFADIGSHLCDLVEFVSGEHITKVGALSRTLFSGRTNNKDIQTEDLVAAVFATESGTVGNLLVSQVAPGRKNRLMIEIAGSEGTLQFDQEAPETLWLGKRAGSQLLVRDPEVLSPDAARLSVLPAGHPQGYQDAFNAFVADTYAAIDGDVREGLPTFQDGLRSAILTESIIKSSKGGEWVDVPNTKELEGVQQ
ncbi:MULTISPECIES: Gfo/Idh/MocA family oxidoreductase [Micrococcaceae]|jgi:predicted dehydrogenase|uniref:Oxidoreductase family, NAD-binding Rossmann fold domain protein n=1 Tax=Paenarthrobacter aurescens (strain TC1) TaxID=290340 RepID=A1R5X3_PAEAT|nr:MULTISPECIES: Gfo/Idh/MocA family oxidoreductase [Micrococcaceae]ABM09669.1 oxidoreductase family, NAD-binding Rossmann fold domain protein [Paenarthrobacter aurescens TC1]AFR28923.1 putative oxidoreductase [Arthrobacter sp. Rue61a]MBP2266030.1 putative dehydrogenase [Pseudarthrobacter sp. PvP004]